MSLYTRIRNAVSPRLHTRRKVAVRYLKGNGIEIGALHNPLRTAHRAKVSYVDRMTVEELRMHYPELRTLPLVTVDIVDDGETLQTIPDASLDFVIANHFIEHCQNPLLALTNMLRVLRCGGVLYLAIPDKRYTPDLKRPVTDFQHLLRDFQEGPAWSERSHYEEWAALFEGVAEETAAKERIETLMAMGYSIHFHVWTSREMMEMLVMLQQYSTFDIELALRNVEEMIFILRKA